MNDLSQSPSVVYSDEMVDSFKRLYVRISNNVKGTYRYKHEVGTSGTTMHHFSIIPYYIQTPCASLIHYIGAGLGQKVTNPTPSQSGNGMFES